MSDKESKPSEEQLRKEFEEHMKDMFPSVGLEMQENTNYYYSTAANVGWAFYRNMRLGSL
ncbi:g189 [Yersinia phage phiR1-37]|uniref:hypothetical protein n=1 Tax=Yersinia phage phiR1-37 TaxID=331278 RepID=UPI00022DBD69|nr:hypothetical protein phiR1-37_gp189 [Yersinia phage phiR1-37]CCE26213.1 g189 [Yersinia phage phiR1-37]